MSACALTFLLLLPQTTPLLTDLAAHLTTQFPIPIRHRGPAMELWLHAVWQLKLRLHHAHGLHQRVGRSPILLVPRKLLHQPPPLLPRQRQRCEVHKATTRDERKWAMCVLCIPVLADMPPLGRLPFTLLPLLLFPHFIPSPPSSSPPSPHFQPSPLLRSFPLSHNTRGPPVENRVPSHRWCVPYLVLLDQLPKRLGRVPVVSGANQVRHHGHGVISRQRQRGSSLAVSHLQGETTRACVCVCVHFFLCVCVRVCVCEGFSRTAQHMMALPFLPPAADQLRHSQRLCRDKHISVLP